ncbi:MAG: hypothetical protein DRP11_00155 [Candidatus Aenigmatarchaeota archaeon]|nr:MAG: hypothetical protein DRP11_00155 [Candidatus Aenigmarchaeota archaeon]
MNEAKKNPLIGLSKRERYLEINGQKIKIKPKVKDAEMFSLMKRNMTEEDMQRLTTIMKNIIKRANPEVPDEDIEAFITENYGTLILELSIYFGYTSRREVERLKKEMGLAGVGIAKGR